MITVLHHNSLKYRDAQLVKFYNSTLNEEEVPDQWINLLIVPTFLRKATCLKLLINGKTTVE